MNNRKFKIQKPECEKRNSKVYYSEKKIVEKYYPHTAIDILEKDNCDPVIISIIENKYSHESGKGDNIIKQCQYSVFY